MKHPLRSFLRRLGPGFITGAADDDPSGIATYTQIGAQFGLAQLWTALFGIPFMIGIQEMVGRIGMVAGEGIGAILHKHYGRWVLWTFVILILIANTINIGTDLGAMADATRLLIPGVPFAALAIGYTLLILILEIFLTYQVYARILKWFALSLFSYVLTAIVVTTNWHTVFAAAVWPQIGFNHNFLLGLVAVAGTTISPYLFIWQANEEVEEEIVQGRKTLRARRGATAREIRNMRIDTSAGMAFSNIIMFFIMVTAAMTFFAHGITNIQTSADAARALRPLAGPYASILFAIGIVGTGLLAVPVLSASASYVLSEAFRWSEGLYRRFKEAHGFYGVITVATLIGLLINFTGLNPIKALFWTAVINGIVAAPLILVILFIGNNKKIMGKWRNSTLSNVFGIANFILLTSAAIATFLT